MDMNILLKVLAVIAILFLVGCGAAGGSGGGAAAPASVSSSGGLSDEALVKMGIKETYGHR